MTSSFQVELVRRDDVIVPVSMWMKRKQNRCLVIFEPVARVHSDVIIAYDVSFFSIFSVTFSFKIFLGNNFKF